MQSNINKYTPIYNVCLLIIAGVALTVFLAYTKAALMPFVIALFISMLSNTAAEWMHRHWRVPRVLGLMITVAVFLGFMAFTALFVAGSIESFLAGKDLYSQKINDEIVSWIITASQGLGFKLSPELLDAHISKIPLFGILRVVGESVVSIFTSVALICLFVVFMFMGSAAKKSDFAGGVEKRISRYLAVKTLVSLAAAVLTFIVLVSLRCELAFMLAFLTFMLNFVPTIGPMIATVLPVPILFLQFGLDWRIAAALILLSAIHFTVGSIFETKWLGSRMEMSPVVVILSLIFWALVWGVMGVLLAVPMTAILKMILEHSEPTKPFAEILEGKLPF